MYGFNFLDLTYNISDKDFITLCLYMLTIGLWVCCVAIYCYLVVWTFSCVFIVNGTQWYAIRSSSNKTDVLTGNHYVKLSCGTTHL